MATPREARAGARARLRRVVATILERKEALRAELSAHPPLEGLCARSAAPTQPEWCGFLRTCARDPTIEVLEAERDALARLLERLEALEARRDALDDAQRAADARVIDPSAVEAHVTRAAHAIVRARAARATGLAALNARFGGATVVVDDAADTSFDATLRRCLEAELEAATAEARDALESDEVRAVNEWAKRSIAAAADAPPPPLASPPSCSRTALEARHAELHARAGGVKVTVDYWVRSHEDAATRLVLLRLSECLQHSLREHARLVSIAAASPAPDARREADTYDAIVVGPIAAQYAEVEARIDADALAPLDDADPALDARLDALAQLREAQAELQRLQGRWGCEVALADALANRALEVLAILDADADADPVASARAQANSLVLSSTWTDANHRGPCGVDEAVRRMVEWARSMTTKTTTATSKKCHQRAGHAPLPSLAAAAAACRRFAR